MAIEYAAAIVCMDGFATMPVTDYMKKTFRVKRVDLLTTAGADKDVDFARNNLKISVEHHKTREVAVAGHAHCAGFPVSQDEHLAAINIGVETVVNWNLGKLLVVGLWVDENGQVYEVARSI